MLNVGLLGAGRIAGVHATAISSHPESTLAAISDVIPENASKLASQYGSTARTTEEIISDEAINAVLIATSTDTHSDLIEAATAAGKAVLCEKPVDLGLERARACQKMVVPTNMPVMVGFNRRFDPHFAAIKKAVDANDIGKIELLAITSYDPSPPPVEYIKVSGGLFRDMMIHDFDMANFILGEPPQTVTAVGSCLVDPAIGEVGDVDTAAVTLSYADGRIATIRNTRRAGYGDQRLEVQGSQGMLQVGNLVENLMVKSTATGVTSAKPVLFFLERYMPAYAAEWNAVVDAVVNSKAVPVSLEDGVMALAMAEAATRSAKTGNPVEMSDV